MAFPHILGVDLGSDSPPRMRSFAYNFGIRPEEASNPHCFLGELISEKDLGFFSGVYFSILAPIGDVVDPRIYAQRCRDYYQSFGSNAVAFAAVAAGVAALGSFLSANRHPRESDLVQNTKAILDDPASMRLHSIDHIVAWGMRLLYLRATTCPSNVWIASCTQMHLCEAIRLHEEENIKKMASIAGAAVLGHDADRLRRIFWISWAGHNMLSYEYDRSPVHFRAVTCRPIIPVSGSVADQFIRKPDEVIKLVIDTGNAAVGAAEQQANQGRLFWNVIGSVFQYACILLAIDTPAASVHIGAAFKGLEGLVQAANTRLTREALSMARHLLSLNMAKKRRDLAQLEAVEANYQFFPAQPAPEPNTAVPDINWEVDWDQFFIEPYLSMLGLHTQ
ncbi:hypothetical protein BDW66DRAFT_163197 [Aspergillus desertorum]